MLVLYSIKGGISLFYTLNCHILQFVGTKPYVGVTLFQDLAFDSHAGNITKNSRRMLGFIQINLKGSPSRLKKLAYLTLVRFSLEYRVFVCDPFLQRVARFVTNNYSRECGLGSTHLIDSLVCDSLQERRKTAKLCMLYKEITREIALSTDMLCRRDSRTRGSTQHFRPIQTKKRPFTNYFIIRAIPV